MHECFPCYENFITSTHLILGDLVQYQSVHLSMKKELIRKQRCFLETYDEGSRRFLKPSELGDSRVTSISFIGEFDLLPEYVNHTDRPISDEISMPTFVDTTQRPGSEEVKIAPFEEKKNRTHSGSDYNSCISKISDDNSNRTSGSASANEKEETKEETKLP